MKFGIVYIRDRIEEFQKVEIYYLRLWDIWMLHLRCRMSFVTGSLCVSCNRPPISELVTLAQGR